MKRAALTLLGLALLVLLGATTWIARLSPQLHDVLMAQVEASGLAEDESSQFDAGWLNAHSQGRLRLADSFCKGCDVLDYKGVIRHGLGALLSGDVALASADYTLSWPQLPLDPALPPLRMRAQQALRDGLTPALRATLALDASAHGYDSGTHRWQIEHGGVAGQIRPGHLTLSSPRLTLTRDDTLWLTLDQLALQAAAADRLMLEAELDTLAIAPWDWQGRSLALDYTQYGITHNLNFDLRLALSKGQLGDQPEHGALSAALHVERLNLTATRAFISELPRLLSNQVSGAARMMGLLSLYSVHGPGFFAEHPALTLHASDVPLLHGQADIDVNLAVTAQTRRPPMHPMEWRRALQGRVDIVAPPQHLSAWWHAAASFVNYVTGLPRDYHSLKQQGWVEEQTDGRDRLLIVLDPQQGPRKP